MARTHKPLFRRKAEVVATNATTSPASYACPMSDIEADTPLLIPEVDTPASTSAPAAVKIPMTDWQLCGDTVIGLAHRRKGIPCQDAVAFRNLPRPILGLSDGAGSAAISERGAQALVIGITRFLRTLEDDLASWLDGDDDASQAQSTRWAERLRMHAKGLLADLASTERRDVRDVRATLQVVVIGERHVFWWKVGDGAIVARNSEGLWSLGNQASAKGEFANQTCFVDTASTSDVQFGVLSASEVFGIALMSDGGAERLVSHDGSKVASRLGEWFDDVAEQRFTIDRIALAFHEPAMWERTSLDDRSIVLAARAINKFSL
ncbi:PP2C family serine/threonine-protein phosphatase [Dechloromonas agitata]|uniref:PP2C family serine/threonine-protein phosphatase n=1 Tax=Dechloromonas agitata TaxID=73030 RepID=UPI0009FCB7E1|nr:PP2C family serine/threonine-protein phosphatase [Dechloromonas agitata]